MIEDYTLPLTQENIKEIMVAALRNKTQETAMTEDQLSQVVSFVTHAIITYGTAQALLEGDIDVSVNEAGQLMFTTTGQRKEYAKTIIEG